MIQVKGSGLSDVCEFRLSFMRQTHLHNNWSRGRVKMYEMAPKTDFFRQPESCCIFYGNDLAITNGLPKRAIMNGGFSVVELWDVKGDPTLISEIEILLARANVINTSNQVFFSFGDFLVSLDVDLVHVLKITPKSRKLQFKHSFYFHQENKSKGKVKKYSSIRSNRDYSATDSQGTLIGPMFFGSYSIPTEDKKMHIWNVETGLKLKEETFEDCTFVKFYGDDTSRNCENLTIVVQKSESIFKTLIYDITQLAFKPFLVTTSESPEDCKLLGQFIAVHTLHTINMYNVETSKLVKSFPAPKYTSGLCTFDNRIGLVFKDKGKFHAFNTLNEEVEQLLENDTPIRLFQSYFGKLFMYYDDSCCADYFNMQTKLLLLKRNKESVVKTVQLGVGLTDILCCNQLCTKFLLYLESDSKKVLNFW